MRDRRYQRNRKGRRLNPDDLPEVEGEYLNESADSMLTISDSLGNMENTMTSDVDSSLLDEFDEDLISAPKVNPAARRKGAVQKSRSSRRDQIKVQAHRVREKGVNLKATVEGAKAKVQVLYQDAKVQGDKLQESIKSKPYLFILGALVAGFTFARMVTQAPAQRR